MVCGALWLHALGDHAKIQILDPVDPASMMIPRYSSANIKWIKVQMAHMHQARNFSIVKGAKEATTTWPVRRSSFV